MILLTLVGSFMAFTGIILHAIARLIDQSIRRLSGRGEQRQFGLMSGRNG